MNSELVFEILELALALARRQSGVAVAESLLAIIRKGVQAYEQFTGEVLDPSRIRIEERV